MDGSVHNTFPPPAGTGIWPTMDSDAEVILRMGEDGLRTMKVVSVRVPLMCSTVQGASLSFASGVDDPPLPVRPVLVQNRASEPTFLSRYLIS
jgi:hypothetical protein